MKNKVPLQLVLGFIVDPEKIEQYYDHCCGGNKPGGGLWSSSCLNSISIADAQKNPASCGGSEWYETCKRSHWSARVYQNIEDTWEEYAPHGTYTIIRILHPKKYFVIDSENDLRILYNRYGCREYGDRASINWMKMLAEKDENGHFMWHGVHLTNEGQWSTRHSQIAPAKTSKCFPGTTKKLELFGLNTCGWDVESTVTFRRPGTKTIEIIAAVEDGHRIFPA